MTARVEVQWNTVIVYVNDVLHAKFKKEDLVAIQSWIEGYDNDATYHIQYKFKDTKMRAEYWDINHWKEVLRVLNEAELF